MKTIKILAVAAILLLSHACNTQVEKKENTKSLIPEEAIFPKGELGPATNFTGNAYNFGLVENDSVYNTLAGNVYFEKGARSNWHVHPSGQILIVLDGEGYHQLEGQPKQTMKKGDVVECPPNVKHWHGATENNSLTQMYILPKTENGIVTWLEAVTDEQYISN
ncbi:cupin domain-containing protein [Algoriphagus aestuariicola]|uniref:Cupin domain-containing protein n=1 Tax=Algoriphagus aestuariicola TaxID=1852016 RepID=A0ABS3BLU5_9BACT|nr:cupin domain-containing protein [Algoriphagus aestuariicola]MBN7800253.1 cupin domain-containing protein [Algoriphagus aestuariicola]